jgi:hypothetical protein
MHHQIALWKQNKAKSKAHLAGSVFAIFWRVRSVYGAQVDISMSNIVVLRVSGLRSHHQALKVSSNPHFKKQPPCPS